MLVVGHLTLDGVYKVAFAASLIVLAGWLIIVFRTYSARDLLSDYWKAFRSHQSLVSIVSISILSGIVVIVLLAVSGYTGQTLPFPFYIPTREFAAISVIVIGVGIGVFFSIRKYKNRFDLLDFWSKEITVLSAFMVLGSSLAFVATLEYLALISPYLQGGLLLFLFFVRDLRSESQMRVIVGLMFVGLFVTNSLALALGWGATSSDFRSALTLGFSALEDIARGAYSKNVIVNEQSFHVGRFWDEAHNLFISEVVGGKKVFVAENAEMADRLQREHSSLLGQIDSAYNSAETDLFNFEDSMDVMIEKSDGLSLTILRSIKDAVTVLGYYMKLIYLRDSTLAAMETAIVTAQTEEYSNVEDFATRYFELRDDNEVDEDYAVYAALYSSAFRNLSNIHVDLSSNGSQATMLIEVDNHSQFEFNSEIYVVMLPQCRYYPVSVDRDWYFTLLAERFQMDIKNGTNFFSISYDVTDLQDCNYEKETVVLFIIGELDKPQGRTYSYPPYYPINISYKQTS